MKRVTLLALAFSLAVSSAWAADHGTADEAVALVKKAVTLIKANGKEKAYATFTAQDPQFIDRDLYVFVSDLNGVTISHGANPKLVGKDMSESADVDGKFWVKERIEKAKTQKTFWVDYKFTNPTTKKIEPKSSYCEIHDAAMVCVGFYK